MKELTLFSILHVLLILLTWTVAEEKMLSSKPGIT